jgi:hypothetical protein
MSAREPVHHPGRAAPGRRGRSEQNAAPQDRPMRLAGALQRAGLGPGSLSARDVLQLQRALGNQAVGRFLAQPARHRPDQAPARSIHANQRGRPDSTVQRYIGIGEVRHTALLGLVDQFLERTTIPYFGDRSTYHEDRDVILAQLRAWAGQDRRFDEWSDLIDEMDSVLGERPARIPPEAASAIHAALTGAGVAYAIQGSYAARIHGAPIGAGDIDVLVNDMRAGKRAFAIAGLTETGGSYAVSKWSHGNGAEIDLALGSEFGVNIANSETVGGLRVLNVYEVLLGLVLRPEKRQKEQDALFWLAKHKGETLTGTQQETIASRLGLSWAKLMEIANEHF